MCSLDIYAQQNLWDSNSASHLKNDIRIYVNVLNNYISFRMKRHLITSSEYGVNKLIFFYRTFSTAAGNSFSDSDKVCFHLTRPISRLFILNLFRIAQRNVIFMLWTQFYADDAISALAYLGEITRSSCSNGLLNIIVLQVICCNLKRGNEVIMHQEFVYTFILIQWMN